MLACAAPWDADTWLPLARLCFPQLTFLLRLHGLKRVHGDLCDHNIMSTLQPRDVRRGKLLGFNAIDPGASQHIGAPVKALVGKQGFRPPGEARHRNDRGRSFESPCPCTAPSHGCGPPPAWRCPRLRERFL